MKFISLLPPTPRSNPANASGYENFSMSRLAMTCTRREASKRSGGIESVKMNVRH